MSHRLFILSLLAKGALGLVQLATAAALFFNVADKLPAIAQWLVSTELAEDPGDFLAARIMSLALNIPNSDLTFYTYYFTIHGLLHIGVVAALLIGAMWAYPTAILILSAFVFYQGLEWMSVGGIMLVLLSVIDLAVIYLTYHEWRQHDARLGAQRL